MLCDSSNPLTKPSDLFLPNPHSIIKTHNHIKNWINYSTVVVVYQEQQRSKLLTILFEEFQEIIWKEIACHGYSVRLIIEFDLSFGLLGDSLDLSVLVLIVYIIGLSIFAVCLTDLKCSRSRNHDATKKLLHQIRTATTEGERGGGAVSTKEGKSREVVKAGSWDQKAAENGDELNKMSR
ncbi:hypothetical protein Tco_0167249 [Tanacetum coccineum]